MDTESIIKNQIEKSISVKEAILTDVALLKNIQDAAEMVTEAYRKGFKTLLAGSGGSAADAQHIAGEFASRFDFAVG